MECVENIDGYRPIPGYETYFVNEYGDVVKKVNGLYYRKKQRSDKQGYMDVFLTKDGKRHTMKVHRMVALAFIPNPNNYPQINHKDEIKSNNHVSNLEWCTAKYNSLYGTRIERYRAKIGRKICQLTLDGETIALFNSMTEASKSTGIDRGSINNCCLNKRKTAGNFRWEYASESRDK